MYLRRQTFVLLTFSSRYNQLLNLGLLGVHCYLSSAIVLPLPLALAYLLQAFSSLVKGKPPLLSCCQPAILSSLLVLCLFVAFITLQHLAATVARLWAMLGRRNDGSTDPCPSEELPYLLHLNWLKVFASPLLSLSGTALTLLLPTSVTDLRCSWALVCATRCTHFVPFALC